MVGGVLGGSCILSRVSVVADVSEKQLNVHLKARGGPRPLGVPGGGGEWFLALTPVCFPSLHSSPQEEEDTLSLPTSHPVYPPEAPSSSQFNSWPCAELLLFYFSRVWPRMWLGTCACMVAR